MSGNVGETSMARYFSDRNRFPIVVPCRQLKSPFPGFCVGHESCRVAYWEQVDATAEAAAEAKRVTSGALRPKRRIKV